MELINNTKYPAELARAILLYRDLMLATVVAKCGFDVTPAGEVVPAADQPAVQGEDIVTPYGTIDGDVVPIKQGCDFAVMGYARPFPSGRAVTEMDVRLRVGDFGRHWRVFGDRRWMKTPHGFKASPPEPFDEMLLAYDKAYGGSAVFERRFKTYCFENRDGKGFVEREQDVDGLPLPNLEDADHLIQTWRDRPLPAGLAPPPRASTLRGARGFRVDLQAGTTTIEPLAFCFSHPGMLLPAYPAGERFALTGMGLRERLTFSVPPIDLSVQVVLGGREHELSLVPDTLCVFPDHGRICVVSRRAFVYQFIPERVRRIALNARPAVGPPPALTIRGARADPSAGVPIVPVEAELEEVFHDVLRLTPLTEVVESLPLCSSR